MALSISTSDLRFFQSLSTCPAAISLLREDTLHHKADTKKKGRSVLLCTSSRIQETADKSFASSRKNIDIVSCESLFSSNWYRIASNISSFDDLTALSCLGDWTILIFVLDDRHIVGINIVILYCLLWIQMKERRVNAGKEQNSRQSFKLRQRGDKWRRWERKLIEK